MESPQLSTVFSEDYQHFESIYDKHPQETRAVFSSLDELRSALRAFREATIGLVEGDANASSAAVDDNNLKTVGVISAVEPDVASCAVLASVSGSVDHDISSDVAAVQLVTESTAAMAVVG